MCHYLGIPKCQCVIFQGPMCVFHCSGNSKHQGVSVLASPSVRVSLFLDPWVSICFCSGIPKCQCVCSELFNCLCSNVHRQCVIALLPFKCQCIMVLEITKGQCVTSLKFPQIPVNLCSGSPECQRVIVLGSFKCYCIIVPGHSKKPFPDMGGLLTLLQFKITNNYVEKFTNNVVKTFCLLDKNIILFLHCCATSTVVYHRNLPNYSQLLPEL